MNTKLNIGLFGYGCVGSGLFEVLQKVPDFPLSIQKICIKDEQKSRNLPNHYFTNNKEEILENPNIHIIVELINDADEAFKIVKKAIKLRKPVVTANKKMLAQNFETLFKLSKEYQTPILYEAAVAGSIPIIRLLEDHFKNDSIYSLDGILNGTTNYILSNIQEKETSYADALQEAQILGFAEQDSSLDVMAFDSKYKLAILLAHATGLIVKPESILNFGIQNLDKNDNQYAKEKGYSIKLNAHASVQNNKINAYVLPKFIPKNDPFNGVKNEFNAVQISGTFSGKQLFTGKGAGSYPTASAILSDLSALIQGYSYQFNKVKNLCKLQLNNQAVLSVYLRYQKKEAIKGLQFLTIEEDYQSEGYKYLIGHIELAQLLAFNPNNFADIFIAQMPPAINYKNSIFHGLNQAELHKDLCV